MLQKMPDCVAFSMIVLKYIRPQRPQISVGHSLGLFIYNFYGSAAGEIGPISSCFHSAGDRSPHSTA